MKIYHLIGNFIDADQKNNYLIPSYSDHLLLGFFSVSEVIFIFIFLFHFMISYFDVFILGKRDDHLGKIQTRPLRKSLGQHLEAQKDD